MIVAAFWQCRCVGTKGPDSDGKALESARPGGAATRRVAGSRAGAAAQRPDSEAAESGWPVRSDRKNTRPSHSALRASFPALRREPNDNTNFKLKTTDRDRLHLGPQQLLRSRSLRCSENSEAT
jgi:hypothetical protein